MDFFRILSHFWFLIYLILIVSITVQKTKAAEAYSLVTGDSYFPYVSNSMPSGGWSKAVIMAVFDNMNIQPNVDVFPWARGYKYALENKYLGTFPYVYTEQRNREFLFSEPINAVPVSVYVSAQSGITGLDDLKRKILCLPFGYTLDAQLDSVLTELQIVINNARDAETCIKQVKYGRSDFGLINGYFSEDDLRDKFSSLNEIHVLSEEVAKVPLHFIISRTMDNAVQHMREFNTALKRIEQNGIRHKIDTEYLQLLKSSASPET